MKRLSFLNNTDKSLTEMKKWSNSIYLPDMNSQYHKKFETFQNNLEKAKIVTPGLTKQFSELRDEHRSQIIQNIVNNLAS